MENIIKRITTREITEYLIRCSKCGKRIIGSTQGQVAFNLTIHKQGKECKRKLLMSKANYDKNKLRMSKEGLEQGR